MQWKEAIFTLNRQNIIKNNEVDVLLRLPQIRDEIFFPDYSKYSYKGEEPLYSIEPVNIFFAFKKLDISLFSTITQRQLKLCFNFSSDCLNSSISDEILNLSTCRNNNIDIEILLRKRNGKEDIQYKILGNYFGTLENRIRAVLEQIKYNYDSYAQDIISGANWDDDAWDDSYY